MKVVQQLNIRPSQRSGLFDRRAVNMPQASDAKPADKQTGTLSQLDNHSAACYSCLLRMLQLPCLVHDSQWPMSPVDEGDSKLSLMQHGRISLALSCFPVVPPPICMVQLVTAVSRHICSTQTIAVM